MDLNPKIEHLKSILARIAVYENVNDEIIIPFIYTYLVIVQKKFRELKTQNVLSLNIKKPR